MSHYRIQRWSPGLVFDKDPAGVISILMNTTTIDPQAIASIMVTGEDVTVDSSAFSGRDITIVLSGGDGGATGKVEVTFTTTASTPLTYKRTFTVRIKEL